MNTTVTMTEATFDNGWRDDRARAKNAALGHQCACHGWPDIVVNGQTMKMACCSLCSDAPAVKT